ncbi:MAG: hypothetical protein J5I53_08785 [Bradyrhizobiaceae bacterium]|nr:hypothetical protein [Bradyrhizobiaceae bacterium]
MRKYVVLALMATCLVAGASAQKVFLGPTLLFKAGVNGGNIPEGQKTAMNFNGAPDISANLLWLFNKDANIGLIADLAYNTVSYRMRPESEALATDDNTIIIKPSYFTIAPSIYFSGFTLGVGFGFPTAISVATVSGASMSSNTDNMQSPAIDVRVGGMIPVLEHSTGRLSALIHFAYSLTGINKSITGVDDTYNPKVISGGLGLAYHFNLTKMME